MELRTPQRILFTLLLVLTLCEVVLAQEKQIGFVLEMKGEWRYDHTQIQQVGESVPAGATLTLSDETNFRSGDEWKITIILLDNTSKSCACNSFESYNDCQRKHKLSLPRSLTTSPWRERFRQVARLLSLNPDRYVPAISREAGGPPQKLQDGVLLLDKGQISIADWFRDVGPGSYALTFVYIGRDGESRNPVVLNLNWNPGVPSSIPATELRPGLYAVRVFQSRSAVNQPISQDAWILLSSVSEFEKDSAAYRNDVQLTRGWETVDSVAAQTFLRASLDRLATPIGPNGPGN